MKNKPIRMALIINIVFMAVVLFWGQPRFDSNDDNAMQEILYGASGIASAHLVYINVLLGFVLKLLCFLVPNVPWYSVVLTLIMFVSFTIISDCMMEKDYNLGLFLSFAMLTFFGTNAYVRVQFSKVSALATVAGAMVLYYGVVEKANWKKIVIGVVFLILGICLRDDMFFCCLLVLSGLVAVYILDHRNNARQIWKTVLVVGCVLGICIGLDLLDQYSYYRDPDLRYYTEFNKYRAQMTDYAWPDYQENEELYQKLNISKYDLQLFQLWDFADQNVFNLETAKEIASHIKVNTVKESIDTFRQWYPLELFYYSWFTGFLLCVVLAIWKRKNNLIGIVYILAVTTAIEFYLTHQGRYQLERVDWSIFFAAFIFVTILFQRKAEVKDGQANGMYGMAVLISIFFAQLYSYNQEYKAWEDYYDEAEEVAQMISEDKEHLYIFSTLNADALSKVIGYGDWCEQGRYDNVMTMGGWKTYLPNSQVPLIKYGISNMFSDVIDAENVYVNSNALEQYIGYLRSHYNEETYASLVKVIDGRDFYSIRSKDLDINIGDYQEGLPEDGFCRLNVDTSNDDLHIYGNVFINGESSFQGKAYIQTITKDGKVYYDEMTQYEGEEWFEDDLSGKYSYYDATVKINIDEVKEWKVWYLLNDTWYLVQYGR